MNKNIEDYLRYEPDTGEIFCKQKYSRSILVGARVGSVSRGYRYVKIFKRRYMAHQLAWYLYYGEWPNSHLDHLDNNPSNNRIGNLRKCTRSENNCNTKKRSNNSSGYKGVFLDKRRNLWLAYIQINKKRSFLGSFKTPEAASEVYKTAAKQLHGEFARW